MSNVRSINDAYQSRKALIETAQAREAELRRKAGAVIMEQEQMLNGLKRLLGCIIEQTGEMTYDIATELNEFDPRRLVLIEREGTWTVTLKDDGDKPFELSLAPKTLPEEMLDREAMERDGVESVPTVPA